MSTWFFRSIRELHPVFLLGDFKRFTSKAVVKAIQENPRESRKEFLLEQFKKAAGKSSNVNEYQFWRHDNKPIELWSNKVIWEKISYVHNNPVESGLVYKGLIGRCCGVPLLWLNRKFWCLKKNWEANAIQLRTSGESFIRMYPYSIKKTKRTTRFI